MLKVITKETEYETQYIYQYKYQVELHPDFILFCNDSLEKCVQFLKDITETDSELFSNAYITHGYKPITM